MNLRQVASVCAIVLGVLLVVGGAGTWALVSSTLDGQRITTPEDACLPNRDVTGPLTAYCQAEIIQEHALEASDGQTYAELARDDPRRETAMQASFLQASLFTSILAFGVSAMAMAIGILFILIGVGIRDVKRQTEELLESARGEPPPSTPPAASP